MKITMDENERDSSAPLKMYISTEQYMFRRIADLCLDYLKTDKKLGRSRDADMNRPIARELANIFESIRSFAAEEPLFPQEIRNPPLNEWSLRQTMDPSLFVLHPRCAKDYIMAVYREIKKQQAKQKRDMTAIAEKFKV
jgi:hypothetical protein